MEQISLFAANDHKLPFSNKEEKIERYFKENLNRDINNKATAAYVLKTNDGVAGYFTLSAHTLKLEDLSTSKVLSQKEIKQLGKRPDLPAILLGMMGVDDSLRGKGIGERLLVDALERAKELSKSIGALAVILHPLNDESKTFFAKYGFEQLESGLMFITIASIP